MATLQRSIRVPSSHTIMPQKAAADAGHRLRRLLVAGIPLIVCILMHSCLGDPVAGTFRVVLDHVERCPAEMLDEPFRFAVQTVRDRRNVNAWTVTVNVTTTMTHGDHQDGHMRFASWSARGGWKDNAYVMKFKRVCASVKTYLPNLAVFIAQHLPNHDCPIPAGEYTFPNYSFDLTPNRNVVPAFYYGKWRIDAQGWDPSAKRNVACVRLFLATEPLPPKPGQFLG